MREDKREDQLPTLSPLPTSLHYWLPISFPLKPSTANTISVFYKGVLAIFLNGFMHPSWLSYWFLKINISLKNCLEILSETKIVLKAPPESAAYRHASMYGIGKQVTEFTFTHINDETTSQLLFFQRSTADLLKTFLKGNNAMIFAYGVTNAGKTYTIQGNLKIIVFVL